MNRKGAFSPQVQFMIQNFWSNTKIYCMNGHKEPIPMIVMSGTSSFYACPHYMLKNEKHPDGHSEDEKMCTNRISFTALTNVMSKLMKIVEKDDEDGIIADYTGKTIEYNGIKITVLKYHLNTFHIGILNRRAIDL